MDSINWIQLVSMKIRDPPNGWFLYVENPIKNRWKSPSVNMRNGRVESILSGFRWFQYVDGLKNLAGSSLLVDVGFKWFQGGSMHLIN